MHPAYYIICTEDYEIDGTVFKTGQIDWKPKECRPIQNPAWRKMTDKEVNDWLKNTGSYDMRKVSK